MKAKYRKFLIRSRASIKFHEIFAQNLLSKNCVLQKAFIVVPHLLLETTVKPVLEAAASNYFDEIFAQNLLSKKCILLKASIQGWLLFKGGF